MTMANPFRVDGRAFVAGPAAPATVQTGAAFVAAYRAVTLDAGAVRLTDGTGGERFAGVAVTGGAADTRIVVQFGGFLDPTKVNVGAGAREEVGVKSDGSLVRKSDPACVSGTNVIGWCDPSGAVYLYAFGEIPQVYEGIGDGSFDVTLASSLPTTIATITVADDSIVAIEAYVSAKLNATNAQAFLAARHVVKRIGGTLSDVDDVEALAKRPSSTTWALTFSLDQGTGTVLVQVAAANGGRCRGDIKALSNPG